MFFNCVKFYRTLELRTSPVAMGVILVSFRVNNSIEDLVLSSI